MKKIQDFLKVKSSAELVANLVNFNEALQCRRFCKFHLLSKSELLVLQKFIPSQDV